MIERPRLLPAVILGAMSLLALKLIAWTEQPGPGRIPADPPLAAKAEPAAPEPTPVSRLQSAAESAAAIRARAARRLEERAA